MSAPARVAGFLVVLVAVFAAAVGIGRAVGPVDTEVEAHDMGSGTDDHDQTHDHADEAAPTDDVAESTGLETSVDGYTLTLADDRLPAGRQSLALAVTGPDGEPVTAYDVQHEKRLHLIVVRRDLTGFQHVHPVLDPATGVWSTEVRLGAGAWRVFADVAPTGAGPMVLGTDLLVPGDSRPAPVRAAPPVAEVDDYRVTLDGDLTTGESELTLGVSRDGRAVTDLQPYLGSYGHLVALRGGDLAYLHVHPDAEPGPGVPAGPDVVFHASFPSPGVYGLFLDFRHAGEVRTAAFTVEVTDGSHGGGHDH